MMESPRSSLRPRAQGQPQSEEAVNLELLVRKIAKCDRLLSASKKKSKNPTTTTTKRLLGKRAEYLQQLGEMTYRAALESVMEDEQAQEEHDVVASSLKSPTGVTERLDVSTTTFFQEDKNDSSCFVGAAGPDDHSSSTPTQPFEVCEPAAVSPPVLVSSSSSPVNTLKQKRTRTTTATHKPPTMVLPSTHSHNSDCEGGVTQKKPASPSTTTPSSSFQVQKHNLDLLLSSLPAANTQDLEEDQSNEQHESSSSLPTTTSVQAARRMIQDAQEEEEEEDSTLADTLGREDEPVEKKDRMPRSAPVITSQAEPTVVVESPVEAAVAAAAAVVTETVEDGSIADTIDSSSNHRPVLLEEADDKTPSSLSSSSSSSDENVMLKAVQTLQRLEQHHQHEKATTKKEELSSLASTAMVPPPPPPAERQKDDTTTPIITTPKTKTTKKKKKKSKAYSDGSIHKKVRGKFDTLESSSSSSNNHLTGSPRRSARPKRAEPLMVAAPPPILNEKTREVVEDTSSSTTPPAAVTSKTVTMQVRVTQPASSDETKGLSTKQIETTTLQQAVMTSSVHDIQSPVIALVSLFPESLYEFLPQQSRALLILQALDIQPIYIDGSDPKEKDRRNELFDLSGKRGVYPQLFVRKQETGKVEYFADFEKIQVLHDCGILKESLEKAYQ